MSNQNAMLQTFAGGEFGEAMSARVGIEAYQASCETMDNFFCQAQGPMFRRPSMEFIEAFVDSGLKGVLKSFQFDVGQNYLLLLTDDGLEFILQDGRITIPEITATISNGTFSAFTDWTDNSETGSSAGASGGYLALTSNGASESKARTTFTINEADEIHVLRFEVVNGPVNLRIGSGAGGSQFLDEMELRTGTHQLEFTPTGSTGHIEFWHKGESVKQIDNVSILEGPEYSLETPWAEEDMRAVYTAQDGDRLWMLHRDYPPRVLERRGHRSWSMIYFEPNDGPFEDGDETIQITPSARYGSITLTASRSYFQSTDVRRLIRLTHPGQYTKMVASNDAVYGDPIKVVGIGADRAFTAVITGTFVGTVTLERSVGNTNQFSKVLEFTAVLNETYNDTVKIANDGNGGSTDDALFDAANDNEAASGSLNNLTIYYRFVIKPGNYTSGSITAELTYAGGGSTVGIARIISYSSGTSVGAEVIKHFANAGATDIWEIGSWCDTEEWPNIVSFSSSRLWMARRRRLWASVVDDYFSFDDGEGLADELIDITIRSKSSEGIRWMRHLDFLCLGTRNEEYVMRSNNTAEGIGPTTIDPGLMSEEGGSNIEAVVGGDSILFVHRSGRRLMQFTHNPRALSESSFVSIDLNRLNPESVEDGIISIAIQQEPERRVYAVLRSGVVKTALFRREEEIIAWGTLRSEGSFIEDVCIFPEEDVDAVYFIVRRYVDGGWVRYIERLGNEVVLNEEDMVHLDSMLATDIRRPSSIVLPDAVAAGATVTLEAAESAFEAGDVGKIVWIDNGRVLVTAYNSVFNVTGTILTTLDGEQDPDDDDATIPRAVPAGKWGVAEQVTSVTGLDHLEGETVQIWGDRAHLGSAVVASGSVTLPATCSRVFVGKRVISKWKGLKLAYGAVKGTAVNQKKNVNSLGFVLRRTADSIYFGQDFRKMKRLVLQTPNPMLNAPELFTGEVNESFNGTWALDPRLTIKADTPGPATIVALVPNVQTNERG
jgi:hypothetical protein